MPPQEVPPDVRKLDGLNELIASFYKEADIEDLWKQSQPALDRVIAAYHGGVVQALLEANAYLRNPTSGLRGSRFQVYVDLLGAPNQIQTRSYKNNYYVVVTPSAEPQVDQVRHAYLHFLLDPLSLRYFEQWGRDKSLADYAQSAPALEDAYKNDFMLLATECVIKSVESRLARGAKKQELVGSGVDARVSCSLRRWPKAWRFTRNSRNRCGTISRICWVKSTWNARTGACKKLSSPRKLRCIKPRLLRLRPRPS